MFCRQTLEKLSLGQSKCKKSFHLFSRGWGGEQKGRTDGASSPVPPEGQHTLIDGESFFVPKYLLPLPPSILQVPVTLIPGKHASQAPPSFHFLVITNNATAF